MADSQGHSRFWKTYRSDSPKASVPLPFLWKAFLCREPVSATLLPHDKPFSRLCYFNLTDVRPFISVAREVNFSVSTVIRVFDCINYGKQISEDARKAEAIQLTEDLLTAAKVEVTPQIEKIIDGCVEAAVFTLPKTHNDANVADSDAQPESGAVASDTTDAK